jgi:hypothetical protein
MEIINLVWLLGGYIAVKTRMKKENNALVHFTTKSEGGLKAR